WGCTMLGLSLMQGKGVARDPERARSALERACKSPLDRGPACLSARKLLERLAASPGPDPD
ncbi:MAG: SEL1-like repeat protein, partial [Proteobacteria bacterium]|nr:SEL1-like repeat protein [Pseudomonadota bacterium]